MKTNILKELNPCEDGYKFAKSKNSLLDAWETCERGDWLLWFAQRLGCPLKLLTLTKGLCAKTVMHLMQDKRSRQAVKVAIDFGNGNASREELFAAAYAAHAAANAAAAKATDHTAEYEYAAKAAYAAAADCTADDAAAYAGYAAYTAADYIDAEKKANQLKTANICREILTDFIKSVLTEG